MQKDYKMSVPLKNNGENRSGLMLMLGGVAIGIGVGLVMYLLSNYQGDSTVSNLADNAKSDVKIDNISEAIDEKKVVSDNAIEQISHSMINASKKNEQAALFEFYALLPELEVIVPGDNYRADPGSTGSHHTSKDPYAVQTAKIEAKIAKIKTKEAKAAPEPKKLTKKGRYTLQIASYRNASQASSTLNKLKSMGLHGHIQLATVKNASYHRVILGPESDLKIVDSWRSQLASIGIITQLKPRKY